MTRYPVPMLLCLTLTACGRIQHSLQAGLAPRPATFTPSASGKKVLILWGQSGMQGTGQYPHMFGDAPNVKYDSDHMGPGYYAALQLAARYPQWDITIINCTKGGSQISVFEPGHGVYEACIAQVKQARADGAELIGLLAYQGESDARYQYSADWPGRFTALMANFREDLDMRSMPIVFAQLGILGNDQYHVLQDNWNRFKVAQAAIRIDNCVMIKTDDQPVIDDVHHDYAANAVIGERFERAYGSLI